MTTQALPQPLVRRELPYYIKALAMAIPALMLGFQISGWIFFSASIRDGHPDFRANYTAGYLTRSGRVSDIYNYDAVKQVQDGLISHEPVGMPFIHPAYEALFFAPYGFLSFHGAYFAFLATNLILLAICYRLVRSKLNGLAHTWQLLPAGLFVTFLPVAAALMQEQDSILLLTLLTFAYVMLDGNRDMTAGLLAGLGLFRLQLAIPIAVAFLLWRRWRFLSGFALSAATVICTSVWLTGISEAKRYLGQLASMSIGGSSQLDTLRYAQPITHMGNLRALIFGLTSEWLSPHWGQILTISLSAVLMLSLTPFGRKLSGSYALLVAITASVIVSYHCFIHDMSILVLPVAIALSKALGNWRLGTRNVHLGLASAFVITTQALMVFAPFHFYLICLPLAYFLFTLIVSVSGPELDLAVPASQTLSGFPS